MLHAERDGVFDYFTRGQRALVPQALERWRAFVHGAATKVAAPVELAKIEV